MVYLPVQHTGHTGAADAGLARNRNLEAGLQKHRRDRFVRRNGVNGAASLQLNFKRVTLSSGVRGPNDSE